MDLALRRNLERKKSWLTAQELDNLSLPQVILG